MSSLEAITVLLSIVRQRGKSFNAFLIKRCQKSQETIEVVKFMLLTVFALWSDGFSTIQLPRDVKRLFFSLDCCGLFFYDGIAVMQRKKMCESTHGWSTCWRLAVSRSGPSGRPSCSPHYFSPRWWLALDSLDTRRCSSTPWAWRMRFASRLESG